MGRLAGLIAAAWLATNYVYVMDDRAAIMESLMAAFVVAGWAWLRPRAARADVGTVRGSGGDPRVFHQGRRDLLHRGARSRSACGRSCSSEAASRRLARKAAIWTLAGLTLAGLIALAAFRHPVVDGISLLQLADVRDAQAVLRSALDRRSHHVAADPARRLHAHVVRVGRRVDRVASCRSPRFRDLQPSERLLTLWIAIGGLGTADPRCRQRTPLRVPDPGARRARRRSRSPASRHRGSPRRRGRCHHARGCSSRSRCCSTSHIS